MPRSSTPRTPKPQNAQAFTRKLLTWYARAARDLPWRRTRNPYRVLVSEVMLQQTQVDRVRAFYPRFLARFPDLATLAAAHPQAVREAWEGLGYYARARNLHELAKEVTRRPDRSLPEDPDELLALPGVGPYTAGAVACFAYEKPVAAVDTNVARVIRRAFFGYLEIGPRGAHPGGGHGGPRRAASKSPAPRPIHELARALVPPQGKRAWKFNQALMELGALVCTARKPRCPECPVRAVCLVGKRPAAHTEGSGTAIILQR